MLSIAQLGELADAMMRNGLTRLEVSRRGYSVRFERPPSAACAPRSGRRRAAVSPASGVFRARGGDDGLPALSLGAGVAEGETLGFVAVGPVLIPCLSPSTGALLRANRADGAPVEDAEPLFVVESQP